MAGQPEKRSTLGHLLNVSMPFDKDNPVWRLICKGVTELEEEFNPDTDDQQFICDDVKSTILKTYAPSFEISMGYQKDDLLQYYFDVMSRRLPTGEKTNIEYIRFNKNETMFGTSNQFIGVRWNANIRFDSIGGSGDDYLTAGMTVAATGTPEVGYVSVADTGNGVVYEWHKADVDVPFVLNINGITMGGYYAGIPVNNTSFGVSGKGLSGKSIELKSDTGLSASDVEVDAAGNWIMSIDTSSSIDGIKNFAFIQKDTNNSSNKSVSTKVYSVSVPVKVPIVTTINGTAASSVTEETTISNEANKFTVVGTGIDGYKISLVEVEGLSADEVVVSSNSWSMDINILSGHNGVKSLKFVQKNPVTSSSSSNSIEYKANISYTNPV